MAWTTEPQGLEPYDFVMEKVLNTANKDRVNGAVDQLQVEELMNIIGYHESAGTMDPSIAQYGGGPGRGIYQYELESEGGSGAGRTAMNNLLSAYGDDYEALPKWAQQYFDIKNQWGYANPSGDVDFSELTSEQQSVLFLADKLQDPNVKLADIGVISDAEWWSKYHHKGESDTTGFAASKTQYLNNRR